MNAVWILVTSAALGIEVGWEPLPGGGHEYTIQLEPQMLEVLKEGREEIYSAVPPNLDIRSYRIIVGNSPLPRDAGPLAGNSRSPQEQPTAAAPGGAGEPTAATPKGPESPFGTPPGDPYPAPSETDRYATTPPKEAEPWPPEEPLTGQPVPEETQPADVASTPSDEPPEQPWFTGADGEPEPGASPSDRPPFADEEPADSRYSADDPQPPAKLPSAAQASHVEAADSGEGEDTVPDAAEVNLQKPELPDADPEGRWPALLGSIALLCCSLGGNFYLGWVAWDQRHRYRDAVAKLRRAAI
ncbi:MAG: hypothetical protein DWQ37_22980 [Planctomycetota bacterium]|nr:MAG: hypothetical protein DWQ37_22980 [Planctomycetota bacterium]